MIIKWFGQAFFEITFKEEKKHKKLLVDPYGEGYGLKLPPNLEAEIVLVTHQHKDHNNVQAVKGNPFVIEGPGEYNIGKVDIKGIFSFHDDQQGRLRGENTIYLIHAEGITVCHLGDFGQAEMPTKILQELGRVDILLVPVGGIYTIGPKQAVKIINDLEPPIVIPMHYRIPGLKIDLEPVEGFLKEIGQNPEPQEQFFTAKDKIAREGKRVVLLKALGT